MRASGIVKYNGKHYFQGSSISGEYMIENFKHYIVDEFEDKYGNVHKTKLEVEEYSVLMHSSS